MADDTVVVCDALCFIVNKYGKVHETTLKSVLTDFYDVECLSKAKVRLMEDIGKLNLSTKRPHVALRRDGDGRLAKEAGDMLHCFSSWMNIVLTVISLPTSQLLQIQCQVYVCMMET